MRVCCIRNVIYEAKNYRDSISNKLYVLHICILVMRTHEKIINLQCHYLITKIYIDRYSFRASICVLNMYIFMYRLDDVHL